jgi:hypothetical protein
MKPATTLYQDSFWNFWNPFPLDNDPFEELVKDRIQKFAAKPKDAKSRASAFGSRRVPKRPATAPRKPKRPRRFPRELEAQTFVSSESKPLAKTPRVIIHGPVQKSNYTIYDVPSNP